MEAPRDAVLLLLDVLPELLPEVLLLELLEEEDTAVAVFME